MGHHRGSRQPGGADPARLAVREGSGGMQEVQPSHVEGTPCGKLWKQRDLESARQLQRVSVPSEKLRLGGDVSPTL